MMNWRTLITEAMQECKENWPDVVACTLTDQELDKPFSDDYGGTEGKSFTLWTVHRVYFPVVYDGAEWCASVSRNPDRTPTCHVGGQ